MARGPLVGVSFGHPPPGALDARDHPPGLWVRGTPIASGEIAELTLGLPGAGTRDVKVRFD